MFKKKSILLFLSLIVSLTCQAKQPLPSEMNDKNAEWYQEAAKRNLSNPILLRFIYASRNPAAAPFQRMISIHGTPPDDYIYSLVGPQSFNLYDEAYISMDHEELPDQPSKSRIIIRAPNQQVYVINFEKTSDSTQQNSLFKVILEKIKDTSAHNQSLQHKDFQEVLKHLKEYRDKHTQVDKEQVDTIDITKGNVLTIIADDLGVYLSKGNK